MPQVPQDYLDFLEMLAKKVAKVVVLSIPTVHVTAHTGKQVGPWMSEHDCWCYLATQEAARMRLQARCGACCRGTVPACSR